MNKILNIFWAVMAITVLLAVLFKDDKKKFIISTGFVHAFVCGFRYEYITGDMHAYKRMFLECADSGWFDPNIIQEGRNTLFYMTLKLCANMFNNNFQVLLVLLAIVSVATVSIVIYRYSESPLISYLMWSCFGFYIFSFSGIKQSFAMSFVLLAGIGIYKNNRWLFYIMTILAGLIHMPAFVFLPAYELCRAKKLKSIIWFYIAMIIFTLLFRNRIVGSMTDIYYESGKFKPISDYDVGGKTIMMIGLVIVGIFLCNTKVENYRITLILMATASIVQFFSVYDNVFTRLADYYSQFIVLYASFILKQPYKDKSEIPILLFNKDSQMILTIGFIGLALLFYYRVNFSHPVSSKVDDLVGNFKFFWQ